MSDKEKIIAYIDKLLEKYPKNYYLLTVADFIDSLQDEPIGEDLEEASKEWLAPQLDKSYVNYGEVKMMELTHFDGYAMLDAIEFGAKWGKNQAMAEIQAQSMALAHGCPEKSESEDLEKAAEDYGIRQGAELKPFAIKYFKAGAKWKEQQIMSKAIDGKLYSTICGSEQNVVAYVGYGEYGKDGDKVKVIVIKEE